MNIDIRKSIINNFINCNKDEIQKSIECSIKDKEEITLPGLGVFFELLWENTENKDEILDVIYRTLNEKK